MSVITLEEKLKILDEHWNEIEQKVVEPLWRKRFQIMYEESKLDFDDFLSLAGFELAKAMINFEPEKSNILTFATNLIPKKAYTELRNINNRDKRKALSTAISLNVVVKEDSEVELIDTIKDHLSVEGDTMSEKRVGTYLNNLSNRQLRILILKLLEFSKEDIRSILDISSKQFNDDVKGLSDGNVIQALYMRGVE